MKKQDTMSTTAANKQTPSETIKGSEYIDSMRREYSLYVMQMRAIVSEADGLKSSGRRLLFKARDGQTYKTQNLAAQTMELHPHGAPDDVACTLAAPFGNNIPLLQGTGLFGTYLSPKAYGATRYTDVKLSKFSKDVVFVDFDIVPMVPNYDMSLQEPKHFLPLVPIGLLNQTEGIAVGVSSSILPRALQDIIVQQINYLEGKKVKDVLPYNAPTDNRAVGMDDKGRWEFRGDYTKTAHNTIIITKAPYGLGYDELIEHLEKLLEKEVIISYQDDSKDMLKISVTFKRGELASMSEEDVLRLLKLIRFSSERIVMVSFDGTAVVERTFSEAIQSFTQWRLQWFVNRYQHLLSKYEADLQYIKDYLLTVDSGMASKFVKQQSKIDLEAALRKLGVVNDEKIARLPAYSFTEEEYQKMLKKKKEVEGEIELCNGMLSSEQKRRAQYVSELKEVLACHKQGKYNTQV